jgi:hypothetical protein
LAAAGNGCQLDPQSQGPFDSDLPVAECLIRKDFRLLGFLEPKKCDADLLEVVVGQLAVLLAKILAEWLEPFRGIDELDLALAFLRLAIA